ncbi:MAG: hypothetical protein Q8L45_01800 [Xanthomonadaceae bacterium]|nr:hypothetical protein [Xanthomonadaceae bacterium]MDZ4377748.1 hypothetical protein [Xanthomonadaceae bacterium]
MDLNLHDKVAIITGASRGIGRAIASALLGEGIDAETAARRMAQKLGVARFGTPRTWRVRWRFWPRLLPPTCRAPSSTLTAVRRARCESGRRARDLLIDGFRYALPILQTAAAYLQGAILDVDGGCDPRFSP